MNILAFELANFKYSIALQKNNKLIDYYSHNDFRSSDKIFFSITHQMLQKHHLDFMSLDTIATLTGPGSFTGIRLGLAFVKGFSLATQKTCLGVTSIKLFIHKLMQTIIPDKNIMVVIESMRDTLYTQLFDAKGNALDSCTYCSIEQILNQYKQEPFYIVGDATKHFAQYNLSQLINITIDARDLINYVPYIADQLQYPCKPFYARNADIG